MSGGSARRELLPSHSLTRRKEEHEKRSSEWRKYAKIPIESIKMISEVTGIAVSNEEMASKISEDVTYRLRELLHHTSIFLRHSKRKKLLTTDIQEVLDDYNVPPIFGHSASQKADLVYINEADVFAFNDEDEDLYGLAFESKELFQLGDSLTKDFKISPALPLGLHEVPPVEPEQPPLVVKQEEDTSTMDTDDGPTVEEHILELPPHLLNYSNRITSVLLGSSKTHYEVVMSDFLINKKIGPIVPFLLNMLAMALEKIPSMRSRFLHAILVLTRNKSFEVSCNLSVHRLVNAITQCALDTKEVVDVAVNDEYHLKSKAAVVLSRVLSEWCQGERKHRLDTLEKLGATLLDGNSPLSSHYGALACVVAIGTEALEICLWPVVESYLAFLENKPAGRELTEVTGAILDASEDMYRREWARISERSGDPRGILAVDRLLEAYLGDALCARRVCQRARLDRPVDSGKTRSDEETGDNRWSNPGRQRLFPSYQASKESPTEDDQDNDGDDNDNLEEEEEEEETPAIVLELNLSKKQNLGEVFDVGASETLRDETEAIEMNFAGGKPVPRERLVRRRVDREHSQFCGPSLYAITNYEAGCTGPRVVAPGRSRSRSKPKTPPNNRELFLVL